MTRALSLIPSACFLMVLASSAAAAPVPEEKRVPITTENASAVRKIATLNRIASRIRRGPGRGEMIFLKWNDSVEVVDDLNFHSIRKYGKDRQLTDFAASRDGKLVAWTERAGDRYTLYDTGSGKSLTIKPGDDPGNAAFSPDGKLLAVGNVYWDPKAEGVGTSEMKLYDTTGKLIRGFGKYDSPGALQPVFSPDGKLLAVGNRNYETRIFDVATGKMRQQFRKRMTQEVAFSPKGKTIACGYVDGTIALWEVATGKLLHSEPSTCKEVYSVDWSPNGDVLATCGREGSIVLWEPRKMTKLKVLAAPAWVNQVRFTADGTHLLTSSADGIVVWGAPGGVK